MVVNTPETPLCINEQPFALEVSERALRTEIVRYDLYSYVGPYDHLSPKVVDVVFGAEPPHKPAFDEEEGRLTIPISKTTYRPNLSDKDVLDKVEERICSAIYRGIEIIDNRKRVEARKDVVMGTLGGVAVILMSRLAIEIMPTEESKTLLSLAMLYLYVQMFRSGKKEQREEKQKLREEAESDEPLVTLKPLSEEVVSRLLPGFAS